MHVYFVPIHTCFLVVLVHAAPWSSHQPEARGAEGFLLQQHSTTIVREATNTTTLTAITITSVFDKPQLWQVPSLQHKPAQPSSFSHFTPSQLSLQYIFSNVPQQCLVHSLMRPYLFPAEQSKHIVYKRWLVRISKQERGVLTNIVMPRSMLNVALLVLCITIMHILHIHAHWLVVGIHDIACIGMTSNMKRKFKVPIRTLGIFVIFEYSWEKL